MEYSNYYLAHHGILGQKWGKRNGPPYPLDAESRTSDAKEKQHARIVKTGEKYRDKPHHESQYHINTGISKAQDKSKQSTKYPVTSSNKIHIDKEKAIESKKETENLKNIFHISNEEAEKYKKIAKIIGVSAATTAGALAVAYVIKSGGLSNAYYYATQELTPGYNENRTHFRYSLDNLKSGPIGVGASLMGYRDVSASELNNIIKTVDKISVRQSTAISSSRLFVMSPDAQRRLSCWSASNAYYLTSMTGEMFASKDYENLIDFNDFGKLFNKNIDTFSAFGKNMKGLSEQFVGKFGSIHKRADRKTLESLIDNIWKQYGDSANTIGFVNGAYHSTTCTHQWNFRITSGEFGEKELSMVDCYSGQSFLVSKMLGDGTIDHLTDTKRYVDFFKEISHYNKDSLRFYAPKLEDFNLNELSKIVLVNRRLL